MIDAEGNQVGIVSIQEALRQAGEVGLDLVQMSNDSKPTVCRFMDYSKHLFQLKKNRALGRKKQKRVQVKEVKFRMGTDRADYQIKLKNLRRFLEGGDKAKVTIRFRGREFAHKDLAMEVMDRIKADLADISKIEQDAQLEGRQMLMVFAPEKDVLPAKGEAESESSAEGSSKTSSSS